MEFFVGLCDTCCVKVPGNKHSQNYTRIVSCTYGEARFDASDVQERTGDFHPKPSFRIRPNSAAGSTASVPPKQAFVSRSVTAARAYKLRVKIAVSA